MIALPPSLAPWSRELSLLDRDAALDLGAIIRRLASLVGSPHPTHSGTGDVDGFEGLSRRGPYDRLLHSEWMLADELPDEFARRAVMKEHAFFELARKQPVQHPLTIALFDSGPSQIGPPRLVHLAALIVLARRAAASASEFRWGVMQEPDGLMFDDVREETIRVLLESRTAAEPTEEGLAAWKERLLTETVGELWLIGATRLTRFPFGRDHWLLTIDELLQPSVRRLSITLRHRTRSEPPLTLDLPSPKSSMELLTNPFPKREPMPFAPPVAPASVQADIVSNIVFVNRGRDIAGRATNGDVVFVLPETGRVIRLEKRPGEVAVAAGWWKGHGPAAIFVNEEEVRVRAGWRSHGLRPIKRARLPVPILANESDPLRPLLIAVSQPMANGFYFLDSGGNLWFHATGGYLTFIADQVTDIRLVPKNGCFYIRRTASHWQIERTSGYRVDDVRHREPVMDGLQAFFGFGTEEGTYQPTAFEMSGGSWIVAPRHAKPIVIDPDCKVIGVIRRKSMVGTALLYLSEDRKSLWLRSAFECTQLVTSDFPIIETATSPHTPFVAMLTQNRKLHYFSVKRRRVIHTINLEEVQ